jgi:hypothetical protein
MFPLGIGELREGELRAASDLLGVERLTGLVATPACATSPSRPVHARHRTRTASPGT